MCFGIGNIDVGLHPLFQKELLGSLNSVLFTTNTNMKPTFLFYVLILSTLCGCASCAALRNDILLPTKIPTLETQRSLSRPYLRSRGEQKTEIIVGVASSLDGNHNGKSCSLRGSCDLSLGGAPSITSSGLLILFWSGIVLYSVLLNLKVQNRRSLKQKLTRNSELGSLQQHLN
jgi:hypothetical protein